MYDIALETFFLFSRGFVMLRDASREIPLNRNGYVKYCCVGGDNNRLFEQGKYILCFDALETVQEGSESLHLLWKRCE